MNIYRYSSSDIQGTLHVLKLTLSCMLTLKFLLSRSCFTTAVCPHFAALCRAVRPFCRRKNIFHVLRIPNNMYTMSRLGQQIYSRTESLVSVAPAVKSRFTSLALPRSAAMRSWRPSSVEREILEKERYDME